MSETTIRSNADTHRLSLWTVIAAATGTWLQRRRAYRARLAFTVWDLEERYGAAAHAIARNSARQAIGRPARRFWTRVAARLRRTARVSAA